MSLAIASASSSSLNVVTDTHRPEDLLLEDAHLVVALEDGRLDVVAILQLAVEFRLRSPPVSTFAPFLLADVDVRQDLLQLIVGRLRADHRARVERIALLRSASTRSTARSMKRS